ncbi:hypothetical protein BD289DRAFT_482822 [Coniella lustricola]|uniref:Uncharacterized protein n=1 Tax=Coniella lustricola TaxID=2025994 RepID=A0A2T3A7I9_9PEZI|nr:hypothetical protein BD289DRAFT_482822 [Coniella lustricola]
MARKSVAEAPEKSKLLSNLQNCIHINKDRETAKNFASTILTSSAATSTPLTQTIWTDASLLHSGQPLQSSHIEGIADISILETLAIAAALNTALDGDNDDDDDGDHTTESHPGATLTPLGKEKQLMVFSDSRAALSNIENYASGLHSKNQWMKSIESSDQEKMDTMEDKIFHISSQVSSSKVDSRGETDQQSAKACQRDIILATLCKAYCCLVQRGNAVQFYWIPGHHGICGSNIADSWAKRAAYQQWPADAGVVPSPVSAASSPNLPGPWPFGSPHPTGIDDLRDVQVKPSRIVEIERDPF